MDEDTNRRLISVEESLRRIGGQARAVPESKPKSNGNGAKAAASIIAVAAVISALVAIVRPMQQQIDFIDRRMQTDDERARENATTLAKMSERFSEVETQFKSLRELVNVRLENSNYKIHDIENWLKWWHKTVPGLDARQNTRLEHLEREHKWDTYSSSSQL